MPLHERAAAPAPVGGSLDSLLHGPGTQHPVFRTPSALSLLERLRSDVRAFEEQRAAGGGLPAVLAQVPCSLTRLVQQCVEPPGRPPQPGTPQAPHS